MFGHIAGTHKGQIFKDRKDLASSGIHRPLMSGIWGAQEGAMSIVLSGGYEDDVDELDYILYTGQGGQNAPGGKQVADQVFTKGNRGLQLSCDYDLPVRVTRGHQIKTGPQAGYRYDGLYRVKRYERVKGLRDFYICRFHLVSDMALEEIELSARDTFKPEYTSTERIEVTTQRLIRNPNISEHLKKLYGYRCQVCQTLLHSPNGPIAIGAHVRPLGKPHDGPDALSNMLCLCPNHHDQFDRLAFYIDPKDLMIVGLDGYDGKRLVVASKHRVDHDMLEYHKQRYEQVST